MISKSDKVISDKDTILSNLLSLINHEIRTPMNGIIGAMDLLLNTELNDEQKELVAILKSSTNCLKDFLNSITDISKIETNNIEIEPVEFHLQDFIHEIMKNLAFDAHEKGIELIYFISPDVPNNLIGDSNRLRQILMNIINSAIKYTFKGEVFLHISIQDMDKKKNNDEYIHLNFAIFDTGIGITGKENLKKINTFTEINGFIGQKYGKSGLNMSMIKILIDHIGGKFRVESPTNFDLCYHDIHKNEQSQNSDKKIINFEKSQVVDRLHKSLESGQGSTFHFNIKLKTNNNSNIKNHPFNSNQLTGFSILIVDDNSTYRSILRETLFNWGLTVITADSGETALQIITNLIEDDRNLPLLLIDLNLLDIDGFTLLKDINKKYNLSNSTIMMLSSLKQSKNIMRCEEYDIGAYITKPLHFGELFNAIVSIINNKQENLKLQMSYNRPPIDDNAQSKSHYKILLAEDNIINQKVTSRMLEKIGHTAITTNNGKEAISVWEKGIFDLILLDLHMPIMNGFGAAALIRKKENLMGRRTPIIALTADVSPCIKERCLAVNIDGYISKPVNIKELKNTINHIMIQNKETLNR